MKKVPLSQGKVSLVDDEDYALVSKFKWYAWKGRVTFYAVRTFTKPNGKRGRVYLHRFILEADGCKQVDHHNHDGLDNRRSNLRLCSASENQSNRKMQKNNSSGFRGVFWDKRNKKWMAMIQWENKKTTIGRYLEKTQAARAYDIRAKELHGDFARLNFPQ